MVSRKIKRMRAETVAVVNQFISDHPKRFRDIEDIVYRNRDPSRAAIELYVDITTNPDVSEDDHWTDILYETCIGMFEAALAHHDEIPPPRPMIRS